MMVPTMTQPLSPFDYLKKILTARVYDVAVESDLQPARALSRRLHNKVLLKREDQQPVFSFKLRGAYNKMAQLTPEQLQKGVICASAGNHAQGTALSARKLGCRAVIVMPTTTPQVKVDAVIALGGDFYGIPGQPISDGNSPSERVQRFTATLEKHCLGQQRLVAAAVCRIRMCSATWVCQVQYPQHRLSCK